MPTFKHPCPACGKFIARDVARCPFCGAVDPFVPGRCPKCRAPIEDPAWIACAKCGTPLREGVAPMPGATPAATPGPADSAPGTIASATTPVRTEAPAAAPGTIAGATPRIPAEPATAAPPATPVPPAPPASQGPSGLACSGCGTALAPGASFCPACGTLTR